MKTTHNMKVNLKNHMVNILVQKLETVIIEMSKIRKYSYKF